MIWMFGSFALYQNYNTLQWSHNERDGVLSLAFRWFAQPFDQAQIKENIKVRRHRLWWGNSPVTGEFPAQRASDADNVSISWRHHSLQIYYMADGGLASLAAWHCESLFSIRRVQQRQQWRYLSMYKHEAGFLRWMITRQTRPGWALMPSQRRTIQWNSILQAEMKCNLSMITEFFCINW